MAGEISEEKRKALFSVYTDIFIDPFAEKYEETWEEEPFWEAVDVFKVKTKEIGVENPLDALSKYKLGTYEMIRDSCKAVPMCGPCTELAPVLSELAERHAGRVAVIGINNDGPTKNGKDDVETVQAFVEERKEKFRYMSYVDNAENFAKNCKFSRMRDFIIAQVINIKKRK